MFIDVFNRMLEVDVIIKPKNKNRYLRVIDNKIQITSEKNLSEKEVKDFILKCEDFVLKRLSNSNEKRADIIHYLGIEYKLKIIIGNFPSHIEKNDLVIYSKSFSDYDIKRSINFFYFETLKDIILKYHIKYEDDYEVSHNVKYEIKDVKTYFGKCFYKERRIVLQTDLAKYRLELILSVLAHELTHFHVLDHSQKFYDFIEKRIPNYKKLNHELRYMGYKDKY